MLTPLPPTDCMVAREAASARVDGELGELDGLRLDAHLASCAECAGFAAAIGGLAGALRQAPLEAAPAAAVVPARRRTRPHLAAVAAAALIVAGAGSAFLVGQQVGARGSAARPLFSRSAAPAPRTDPGLLAMLRGQNGRPTQNHRAVAL